MDKMSKADLKAFRREQAEAASKARIVQMPVTTETRKWAEFIGTAKWVSCMVDASGAVRVWDDVGGHYTLCHSLPDQVQRRARELAAKQA